LQNKCSKRIESHSYIGEGAVLPPSNGLMLSILQQEKERASYTLFPTEKASSNTAGFLYNADKAISFYH
jgi:hypothetical protein